MYMDACVCVCVCVCVRAPVCACVRAYMCMHMYMYVCVCARVECFCMLERVSFFPVYPARLIRKGDNTYHDNALKRVNSLPLMNYIV